MDKEEKHKIMMFSKNKTKRNSFFEIPLKNENPENHPDMFCARNFCRLQFHKTSLLRTTPFIGKLWILHSGQQWTAKLAWWGLMSPANLL